MSDMLIRIVRPHLLPDGEVGQPREFHRLPDDDAYLLIHKGAAVPPLRLRVLDSCLIGGTWREAGEIVDWPEPGPMDCVSRDWPFPNEVDPERFAPHTAVIPAVDSEQLVGSVNVTQLAGVRVVLPAGAAWQAVCNGGRYVDAAEADAILPPLPAPSVRGKLASRVETPAGATVRLWARVPLELSDGRVVSQHTFFQVAPTEANALVDDKKAHRLVRVRVVGHGAIVGNVNHSPGDVVEVPPDLAKDGDRFEPIPLTERVATTVGRAVDTVRRGGRRATPEPVAEPTAEVYAEV